MHTKTRLYHRAIHKAKANCRCFKQQFCLAWHKQTAHQQFWCQI